MQSKQEISIQPELLAKALALEITFHDKMGKLDAITVRNLLIATIPNDYNQDAILELLKILRAKCKLSQPNRNSGFFIGYASETGEELSSILNAIDDGIIYFLKPTSDEAIKILHLQVVKKSFENQDISTDSYKLLEKIDRKINKLHSSGRNEQIIALLEIKIAILNGDQLSSEQESLLEEEKSSSKCCTIQ